MAQLARVRRLSDAEGQRLLRTVRRGSTNTVRYRRAMIVLASADGNSVPVIARLVRPRGHRPTWSIPPQRTRTWKEFTEPD